MAILKWATFALRPLTVAEIAEALAFELRPDGEDLDIEDIESTIQYFGDDYINTEILEPCAALIEVRMDKPGDSPGLRTIHIIHASVREFLISVLPRKRSPEFDRVSIESENHGYITTTCLSYISCNDIWIPADSAVKHAFLRYAARCWVMHVNRAKDSPKIFDHVNEFLRLDNECFSYWARYLVPPETKASVKAEADEGGVAIPLYYAAQSNFTPTMESIYAEDPSQLDAVGIGLYGSSLQAVCQRGHVAAFDLLIHWGADLNVQGGRFGIPLNAAISGGHKNIAKILIQKGANLELVTPNGCTPLYMAATSGDFEIAQCLIQAGANVNGAKHRPLNQAAFKGYVSLA